jgi:hypothetical protein
MSNHRTKANAKLAGLPIFLITAGTHDDIWSRRHVWHHPPDTVMIYTQACQALSETVHIVTLDQFLERKFAEQFSDRPGLVVDIVGGLYDLELIGLPSTVSKILNMPCFPANNKNYITTHDKLLGKQLARNCELQVARTLSGADLAEFDGPVIQKPICGGDSVGIDLIKVWRKGEKPQIGKFVEEFVLGSDATIHFLRNKNGHSYSVLEHLVTEAPESEWFDSRAKSQANRIYGSWSNTGKRFKYEGNISTRLLAGINELLCLAGYPFLGRIDFRQSKLEGDVDIEDMTFLELNVAPTISNANNWYDGVRGKFEKTPMFSYIDELPIHPAAKSLATMMNEFYVQSLSIHGNSPVRIENLPN